MVEPTWQNIQTVIQKVFTELSLSNLFVFLIALLFAYIVSKLFIGLILKFVGLFAKLTEKKPITKPERKILARRAETYLSVTLALIRAAVFAVALITAWQYTNPTTTPLAFIGASTIFIVLAGATIVPTLRDITAGSIMIIERWYNVGDFIVLEPFLNVSGVVERITLRSTKIRSMNGEVVWVHNQHIQAARVTTKGIRNMAIDLFVNDLKAAEDVITQVAKMQPLGPTTLIHPLRVDSTHKVGENLWRVTSVCQVSAAREWLIEKFAAEAITEQDKRAAKPVIVHGPVVRYADSEAERRFRRAVIANRYVTEEDQS